MTICMTRYLPFRAALLSLALFAAASAGAQQRIVTTVVGSGVDGYMGDGGPAIAARISFPVAVARDGAGNLYICEYGNSVIRKVSASGIISTVAGTADSTGYSGDDGPATSAVFNGPSCVAADKVGNLYIADRFNNVIRKVSTTGNITTFAGTGVAGYGGDGGPATAAMLNNPFSVAVDDFDNVYIADCYNAVVRRVSAGGIINTIAGRADSIGHSGDGGLATAAKMGAVYFLALDRHGNVYAGEQYYTPSINRLYIRKIDGAGMIHTVAGIDTFGTWTEGMQASDLYLSSLGPIHVDDSDHFYFFSGNRLATILADGSVHTLGGASSTGGFSFGGDGGDPLYALFAEPNGMTSDEDGNLYIADSYNNRIRKIGRKPTAGMEEVNGSDAMTVYPDPSNGTFRIAGLAVAGTVTVTDMAGRMVHRQEVGPQRADVTLPATLPQGVYLLQVTTGSTNLIQKLTLQR